MSLGIVGLSRTHQIETIAANYIKGTEIYHQEWSPSLRSFKYRSEVSIAPSLFLERVSKRCLLALKTESLVELTRFAEVLHYHSLVANSDAYLSFLENGT